MSVPSCDELGIKGVMAETPVIMVLKCIMGLIDAIQLRRICAELKAAVRQAKLYQYAIRRKKKPPHSL